MRKILPHWWQKEFPRAELVLAFILTVGFVIWVACEGKGSVLDGRNALYGVLASLFGSLLGFSITSFAIMISLAGSPALGLLRDAEHHNTLVSIMASTIRWLGFGTLAALLAFLTDRGDWHGFWLSYVALVSVALAFFASCFRVARTAWVLTKVALRVFESARP